MAPISAYAEEEDAPGPTKRLRWATQRITGKKGGNKRGSIIDRFHKNAQNEKKRNSAGTGSVATNLDGIDEGSGDSSKNTDDLQQDDKGDNGPRQVFFNIPLPSYALDEMGKPAAQFRRNKIRTAKYSPLSFVPKNLWYQFHNIANVYFLFLIILAVRTTQPVEPSTRRVTDTRAGRSLASSAPRILVSTPCP